MLKKLRLKLTVLSSIITGAVLILMAFLALSISERQLSKANETAFKSNINTVVSKLKLDRSLSTAWLAQTEALEGLVIHIEDNNSPLLFDGAWKPKSSRDLLIKNAQSQALKAGLDSKKKPTSLLTTPQAIFEQRGEFGERYLGSVTMILSPEGFQSVTILKDMQDEDLLTLRQRFLFLTISICGVGLLFICGYFVAGKAINPIEKSMDEQVLFVAAASHELRSPLAVIRASADAIINKPADTYKFISAIERECERMARLIGDLTLLAGSDAKTWSIKPCPVEPETLLIETVEMFLPIAAKKQQQISLDLPKDILPTFNGDYERLQQALSVLIDNAIFYTGENCKIDISAQLINQNKTMQICVCDNGGGVTKEQAAHLFERFYRADKSRNDKGHFGLGLSIAQELIALHHGKLYLDDRHFGGCRFVIEIPLV